MLKIKDKMTWSGLRKPVYGERLPVDYLRLRTALDDGWMVTDVAEMIAHGRNDNGHSYLLTLAHMQKLLVKKMVVSKGKLVDLLLTNNSKPIAIGEAKSSRLHPNQMTSKRHLQ